MRAFCGWSLKANLRGITVGQFQNMREYLSLFSDHDKAAGSRSGNLLQSWDILFCGTRRPSTELLNSGNSAFQPLHWLCGAWSMTVYHTGSASSSVRHSSLDWGGNARPTNTISARMLMPSLPYCKAGYSLASPLLHTLLGYLEIGYLHYLVFPRIYPGGSPASRAAVPRLLKHFSGSNPRHCMYICRVLNHPYHTQGSGDIYSYCNIPEEPINICC